MTKKKKKEIVKYKKSKEENAFNSVYMFHNIKHNLYFFTNAHYLEGAMEQFDLCKFKDRTNWKIFVECGQQPA